MFKPLCTKIESFPILVLSILLVPSAPLVKLPRSSLATSLHSPSLCTRVDWRRQFRVAACHRYQAPLSTLGNSSLRPRSVNHPCLAYSNILFVLRGKLSIPCAANISPKVFHLTALSFAFVNLKPLLPGHVLVSPRRPVNRLADLTHDEVTDLFLTVQRVGRTVERVFRASASNVAIQDGAEAGQSVPHLHTHIIPRKHADMDDRGGNDAIYGALEGEEGDVGKHLKERDGGGGGRPEFPKVNEEDRRPRTEEEMNVEAEMLRGEMENSKL